MILKRVTAIVVAFILVVQLAACRKNLPDNSNSVDTNNATSVGNTISSVVENNESQENVTQDIQGDNTPNLENQDNSAQETTSSEVVSSEIQNTNEIPQDNIKNETDNTVVLDCNHGNEDPYVGVSKTEFYANYKVACCNTDATFRSKHGLLSGKLNVPGQYAVEAQNRPMHNGKFVRNTATEYIDNGNTYVVIDAIGREVMRIHRSGGYITLEEVAAYMYAFGGNGKFPANYISKKKGNPVTNMWGEYLRVNHSYFKGDTNKYPYEPELPDISGCGGSLNYYEMDIGTTGTETPGYAPKPYIQGSKINRGAARIVYTRQDLNGNGIYENNEVYVFYTHNHYNDFREYLNYYGGWGEMFGNVSGGGVYSDKYNANPTPYIQTEYSDLTQQ